MSKDKESAPEPGASAAGDGHGATALESGSAPAGAGSTARSRREAAAAAAADAADEVVDDVDNDQDVAMARLIGITIEQFRAAKYANLDPKAVARLNRIVAEAPPVLGAAAPVVRAVPETCVAAKRFLESETGVRYENGQEVFTNSVRAGQLELMGLVMRSSP